MIVLDQSAREFIARTIADMGKAILTVALASYFFEKMILFLRIGFVVLGLSFLIISVILFAWKGEK